MVRRNRDIRRRETPQGNPLDSRQCPVHLDAQIVSSPTPPKPDNKPKFFLLFRKLPIELREMVWMRALPSARVIEIRGYWESGSLHTGYICQLATPSSRDLLEFASEEPIEGPLGLPSGIPSVFHATKESRGVALRNYEIIEKLPGLKNIPFIIDWKIDTLSFNDHPAFLSFEGILRPRQLENYGSALKARLSQEISPTETNLRTLALKFRIGPSLLHILPRFRKLEKVLLEEHVEGANAEKHRATMMDYQKQIIRRFGKARKAAELKGDDLPTIPKFYYWSSALKSFEQLIITEEEMKDGDKKEAEEKI